MFHAEEEEPHVGPALPDTVDGPNRGDGIEPVVDAPTPQHDVVVAPDAVDGAPQGGPGALGWGIGQPEADDVEKAPQRGVALVVGRIHPAGRSEESHPEVPLLLAGTQEEVASRRLFFEHADRVGDLTGAFGLRQRSIELQVLQEDGVVEVDDHDFARLPQGGHALENVALHQRHVTPCLEFDEAPGTGGLGVEALGVQLADR